MRSSRCSPQRLVHLGPALATLLGLLCTLPAHGAEQGKSTSDRGTYYGLGQASGNQAPSTHQWNWYDDSYQRQHPPQNGQGGPSSPRSTGTWSNPSSTPRGEMELRPDGRPWGELPSRYEPEPDREFGYGPPRGYYSDPYYPEREGSYPPPRSRERWDRGYGESGREPPPWRGEGYGNGYGYGYGYESDRDSYGYPGRRWRPDPYDPYGGGGEGAWERPGRYEDPWGGGREPDYGYRERRYGW